MAIPTSSLHEETTIQHYFNSTLKEEMDVESEETENAKTDTKIKPVVPRSQNFTEITSITETLNSQPESKTKVLFLSQFQSNKSQKTNDEFKNATSNRKRTRTLETFFAVTTKEPKLENDFIESSLHDVANGSSGQMVAVNNNAGLINEEQNEITEEILNKDTEGSYMLDEECANESEDGEIKKTKTISISITKLKHRIQLQKEMKNNLDEESGEMKRNFAAKIDPTKNDQAETELNKNLSKGSFADMKIIGQFNLGFIIAQYKQDVFIIDQHASDEKYNFENLQKNSELKGQRLIAPQKLEITAGDILVLEENMNVFQNNGFLIDIKEDENNKASAYLTSVPGSTSNSYSFGASDVQELIFMLNGMSGVMCRPSRIRQMFASKACRKSVMIGTSLNKTEMSRLIKHMGTMDQPWNCPHGRPTMRHLVDLNMVATTN